MFTDKLIDRLYAAFKEAIIVHLKTRALLQFLHIQAFYVYLWPVILNDCLLVYTNSDGVMEYFWISRHYTTLIRHFDFMISRNILALSPFDRRQKNLTISWHCKSSAQTFILKTCEICVK